MQYHHHWNVPDLPATVPGPATVVVRSDCGRRWNLPAWQVREWTAQFTATPPADQTCPTCLAAVAAVQSN